MYIYEFGSSDDAVLFVENEDMGNTHIVPMNTHVRDGYEK